MKKYIIGTRGSLLAVTQTTLVKEILERQSNACFELEIIKTEGDENTTLPLWQMDGKDFFSKELDAALLSGKVDLVVHSYKDLGSERPAGLAPPILPARSFPHDIVLFRPEIASQIGKGLSELKIGTSSPRRMTNIETHLHEYLPSAAHINLRCVALRGNVNTRLEKLRRGEFDAIVLALAGLERLASAKQAAAAIQPLLTGLSYIVLPQSQFPSAASQGALALVCAAERSDDGELWRLLKTIDDPNTQSTVARERQAFRAYGGGCHLAVGIHCRRLGTSPYAVEYHVGQIDHQPIKRCEILPNQRPKRPSGSIFLGLSPSKAQERYPGFLYDELLTKVPANLARTPRSGHFWVTSDHCLAALEQSYTSGPIWAAGDKTWKRLVSNGYWVNGSSDSLGDAELETLARSKALAMLSGNLPWFVLTADGSHSAVGSVIGAYHREWSTPTDAQAEAIAACNVYYWTSFPQFELYARDIPQILAPEKIHCCGIGKTLLRFSEKNVPVLPFVDISDFTSWLG